MIIIFIEFQFKQLNMYADNRRKMRDMPGQAFNSFINSENFEDDDEDGDFEM